MVVANAMRAILAACATCAGMHHPAPPCTTGKKIAVPAGL